METVSNGHMPSITDKLTLLMLTRNLPSTVQVEILPNTEYIDILADKVLIGFCSNRQVF